MIICLFASPSGNILSKQQQSFGSGSALDPDLVGVKSAQTERKNGAKRQKIHRKKLNLPMYESIFLDNAFCLNC
jgi:hypothetical protein